MECPPPLSPESAGSGIVNACTKCCCGVPLPLSRPLVPVIADAAEDEDDDDEPREYVASPAIAYLAVPVIADAAEDEDDDDEPREYVASPAIAYLAAFFFRSSPLTAPVRSCRIIRSSAGVVSLFILAISSSM